MAKSPSGPSGRGKKRGLRCAIRSNADRVPSVKLAGGQQPLLVHLPDRIFRTYRIPSITASSFTSTFTSGADSIPSKSPFSKLLIKLRLAHHQSIHSFTLNTQLTSVTLPDR
ncbi:hypothetical protein FOVSG1_007586 [Fusarium oxysporum f. sp. vasinfectum]